MEVEHEMDSPAGSILRRIDPARKDLFFSLEKPFTGWVAVEHEKDRSRAGSILCGMDPADGLVED